jgi:hypothetical protein
LGIRGPETSTYSYKQVGVSVTIITTNRPTPTAPADGTVHFGRTVTDGPTLTATAPGQANLHLRFEVAEGVQWFGFGAWKVA